MCKILIPLTNDINITLVLRQSERLGANYRLDFCNNFIDIRCIVKYVCVCNNWICVCFARMHITILLQHVLSIVCFV